MTWAGRVIRGFFKIVTDIINKLTEIGKKAIPIAIIIVDAIKDIMANPITGSVFDFIVAFVLKKIQGTKNEMDATKLRAMLEEWLPKILTEFHATEEILAIDDPEERLKALIKWLTGISVEGKNIVLHGTGIVFAEKLSNNELNWNRSATLMQAVYDHPEVLENA